MTTPYGTDERKGKAEQWFHGFRDRLCVALETLEVDVVGPNASSRDKAGHFHRQPWERPGGGGGTMSILRGRVLEKAGVNVSTVEGEFSEEFRNSIPGAEEDPRFWASGVSVVVHPRSPLVPAAHMNVRMISTARGWFGGGADLTPVFPDDEETALFHRSFEDACNRHDPEYYPKFKKWCDEYFFLPHRNESRGVGGVFFDNLNTGNWDADFAFVQDVAQAFLGTYPALIRRAMDLPWTDPQRSAQLVKRGRYVEFNLLYDRGTLFGLKTGGNTEAILMSMPPEVKWP